MRTFFSKKVKLQAYRRAGGFCEKCETPLINKRPEYDHIVACEFGGNSELTNCQCLCRACHRQKTGQHDIPAIAKSRRIRLRQAGIIQPRTITAWRKFDGTIVRAPRER